MQEQEKSPNFEKDPVWIDRVEKGVDRGIYRIRPKHFSYLSTAISSFRLFQLAACLILNTSSVKNSCIDGLSSFTHMIRFLLVAATLCKV